MGCQTPMTLDRFIATNRIRLSCQWTDSNPYMDDDRGYMTHWKVILHHNGERMKLYFSKGSALTGPPTVADVLDCLASDCTSVESASSFLEWCAELGFDRNSRKDCRTYHVILRQAEKLRALLGDDLYRQLLWDVERQ